MLDKSRKEVQRMQNKRHINIGHAQKGASLVSYSIITGLVSVLAIASVIGLGEEVKGNFETVEGELAERIEAAAPGSSTSGGNGAGETGGGGEEEEVEILFNNPSTWPGGGDCVTPTSPPDAITYSGSYVGETCFTLATNAPDISFAGASEDLFLGMPPAVSLGGADPGMHVVTMGSGDDIFVAPDDQYKAISLTFGGGTNYISFPAVSSTDVLFPDMGGAGGLDGLIVTPGGAQYGITDGVDLIWFGGDDVILAWDSVKNAGAPPPSGGGGPDTAAVYNDTSTFPAQGDCEVVSIGDSSPSFTFPGTNCVYVQSGFAGYAARDSNDNTFVATASGSVNGNAMSMEGGNGDDVFMVDNLSDFVTPGGNTINVEGYGGTNNLALMGVSSGDVERSNNDLLIDLGGGNTAVVTVNNIDNVYFSGDDASLSWSAIPEDVYVPG